MSKILFSFQYHSNHSKEKHNYFQKSDVLGKSVNWKYFCKLKNPSVFYIFPDSDIFYEFKHLIRL